MGELLDRAVQTLGPADAGEDIEVYFGRGRDTEIIVRGGEVASLSFAVSEGVGIRVVRDKRVGFAYETSLDDDAVSRALAGARANALFGTQDPESGLPEPDDRSLDLGLWRADLAAFPIDSKVDMAVGLERRALSTDRRIASVKSSRFGDSTGEIAIATTSGIATTHRRSRCYVSVYVVADDGRNVQTGGGWSVGRSPGDLDIDLAVTAAVERATTQLGARKPRSQELAAVFDPRVTAAVLAVLGSTLSAEAALRGRSLFSEQLGEVVAPPIFTVTDDPTDRDAYGAAPHDGEGVTCRRALLIEDGVLRGLLHDSYTARRMGVSSTASAVRAGFKGTPGVGCRALRLRPGQQSQSAIIAGVGDGVFIRSVTGFHSGVDRVSGGFSVGAEGRMIRSGELAEPVCEFTIASNLPGMLRQVTAIGSETEWLPGVAAGTTIALAGMAMSGI
ncbi:MAG: TldD/PmbA family protein [Actinomycetota bacterium]|nr:TldD/PmbA family protein [Actinomycetota bacterium]